MRDGVEIPSSGPLTLQQMVTKAMLEQGYTEQSLAEKTGLPYPTILGTTRKGAIPRGDTLPRLGAALGLDAAAVQRAVLLSKERRGNSPGDAPVEEDADEAMPTDTTVAGLSQFALDAVTRSGISTAAFAKQYDLPYLSLMRLIREGVPPVRSAVLDSLRRALELDDVHFAAALARSQASPEPASRSKSSEIASNPIQASLLKLVEERNLTVKAFADLADLSVLTATRLLKKGDLPGRQATHSKLRGLLGLSQAEYDLLLQRARASGASESVEEEAQPTPMAMPPITEAYARQQSSLSISNTAATDPGQAGGFTEAFAAKVTREPTDEDFMLMIRRLGPKQRRALMGFVSTLVG
jgi:hypothetical protein